MPFLTWKFDKAWAKGISVWWVSHILQTHAAACPTGSDPIAMFVIVKRFMKRSMITLQDCTFLHASWALSICLKRSKFCRVCGHVCIFASNLPNQLLNRSVHAYDWMLWENNNCPVYFQVRAQPGHTPKRSSETWVSTQIKLQIHTHAPENVKAVNFEWHSLVVVGSLEHANTHLAALSPPCFQATRVNPMQGF